MVCFWTSGQRLALFFLNCPQRVSWFCHGSNFFVFWSPLLLVLARRNLFLPAKRSLGSRVRRTNCGVDIDNDGSSANPFLFCSRNKKIIGRVLHREKKNYIIFFHFSCGSPSKFRDRKGQGLRRKTQRTLRTKIFKWNRADGWLFLSQSLCKLYYGPIDPSGEVECARLPREQGDKFFWRVSLIEFGYPGILMPCYFCSFSRPSHCRQLVSALYARYQEDPSQSFKGTLFGSTDHATNFWGCCLKMSFIKSISRSRSSSAGDSEWRSELMLMLAFLESHVIWKVERIFRWTYSQFASSSSRICLLGFFRKCILPGHGGKSVFYL